MVMGRVKHRSSRLVSYQGAAVPRLGATMRLGHLVVNFFQHSDGELAILDLRDPREPPRHLRRVAFPHRITPPCEIPQFTRIHHPRLEREADGVDGVH
jgi:hypothetical protein